MTGYIEIDGSIAQDFAQRTLENLEYIEQQYKVHQQDKSKTEVFEITQLINSLLGLLVFPKEEYYDQRLQSVPLNTLTWVKVKQDTQFTICTDLKSLIHKLRNCISHFHIEADTNHIDEIDYLLLWDESGGRQNWGGEMTVEELRLFVKEFAKGIIDGSLLS